MRSLSLCWVVAAASVPALAAMLALQELFLLDAPSQGSVPEEQWDACHRNARSSSRRAQNPTRPP